MNLEKSPQFENEQLDLLGHPELRSSVQKEDALEYRDDRQCQLETSAEKSGQLPLVERLLIVDTETTGLDPTIDFCLEVGAILFHVPSRVVLAQQSFLIPVQENNAEKINRIPAAISRIDQPWKQGLDYLEALIDVSDLLVAHNAAFDKKWFGVPPLPAISKPWLCTMEDISWPAERLIRHRPSVRDLALAYEIPVWSAHRALADCIYLAEVLSRCENLNKLISHGLEPKRLMRADVSYEERFLAKQAGFRWNDPIKGAWTRRLSERQIQELEFPVVVVELSQ